MSMTIQTSEAPPADLINEVGQMFETEIDDWTPPNLDALTPEEPTEQPDWIVIASQHPIFANRLRFLENLFFATSDMQKPYRNTVLSIGITRMQHTVGIDEHKQMEDYAIASALTLGAQMAGRIEKNVYSYERMAHTLVRAGVLTANDLAEAFLRGELDDALGYDTPEKSYTLIAGWYC